MNQIVCANGFLVVNAVILIVGWTRKGIIVVEIVITQQERKNGNSQND
ncbi:hypothetical protein JNUCC23_01905 [Peribacillus sp. JNUCC 23]